MDSKKILSDAAKEADRWINAINFSGKPDLSRIQEVLDARVFEGKPVKAYVAKSIKEAYGILSGLMETASQKDAKIIAESFECIWDYYYMSLYESACSVLENKDFEGAEFIYQSLLPAFEAGMGFLINLGDVVVGVCLPQAHIDDQQRLHREDGPAIAYPDDQSYWWHGVSVPKEWIEDRENIDPSLCLTHENIEQRRALCEILGWENVLRQLNSKVIDRDDVEGGRELLQVELPDAGIERFVRVRCATGRYYCIPVPVDVNTAREAVAMTYNVGVDEYAPEVRT